MSTFYRFPFGMLSQRTIGLNDGKATRNGVRGRTVGMLCLTLCSLLATGCGQQVYTHDVDYEVVGGFVSGDGDTIDLMHVVDGSYGYVPWYLDLDALPAFEQAFDIREAQKRRTGGTYVDLARQIDSSDGAFITLEVDTSVELGTYETEGNGPIAGPNGTPDLHITTVTFAPRQAPEVPIRNQFYIVAPDQAPNDPPLRLMILVDTNAGQRWVFAERQDAQYTPGLTPGSLNRIDITVPSFVDAPIALTPGVGIPSVSPRRWYVAPDGTLQTDPIAVRHDALLTPGAVLDLSGLVIDYSAAFPPTTEP